MSAHRVFLVVDPAQDYEESLTILGAFGSLAAAQMGGRLIRHKMARGDHYWFEPSYRTVEVQEWVGREHRSTWTYSPEDPKWSHREEKR